MHVIIWEFTVREEHIQEFISACDSDGDWANLFRRAQGYLGTQLLRSSHEPNIFLTVDRWESAACFEVFQERFGTEYKKLDTQLPGQKSACRKSHQIGTEKRASTHQSLLARSGLIIIYMTRLPRTGFGLPTIRGIPNIDLGIGTANPEFREICCECHTD